MQTKYGFTLMTVAEFESWIKTVSVSRSITLLQVHHTWSPSFAQFNGSNHFALQQNMKTYHVNSCGYADIAQNFTVFPDGTIMTGRSLNLAPAGCVGANTNGICVEHLGNFDKGGDTMSTTMKNAIVRIYAAMANRFKINPETGIRYHGWYTAGGTYLGTYIAGKSCKTCPGTNWFGGNTRTAYDKYFKPLIKQAMNGTYTEEDDEVVKSLKVTNMANNKTVTVSAIAKNNGGTNYIKMRDLELFGAEVDYQNGMPTLNVAPEVATKLVLNGETIDAKAVYNGGTNYLAVRQLLEYFGVPHDAIKWDGTTRTITVDGKLNYSYSAE